MDWVYSEGGYPQKYILLIASAAVPRKKAKKVKDFTINFI